MAFDEFILDFESKFGVKKYDKGDVLQKEGDLKARLFYVKKGLLRSYTKDYKGKEHTFMFAPEGWIITDMETQAFGLPSEFYIEALENSEIVALSMKQYMVIEESNELIKDNLRLMRRRVAVLQRRIIMLLSATAFERFEYFLKTYPDLSTRVTQKMIASYLGVTPEALSKLKNEQASK